MKKPFICMNLTQEEWDMLNQIQCDLEYMNDYIEDPIEQDLYKMMSTKPSWA